MKTKLIIGLFTLLCVASFGINVVHAQKNSTKTLATHMWLQTRDTVSFVPVRSVEQCEMLTRQASRINSSQADCYLNERMVKEIECVKSTKRDTAPKCK